MKNANIIQKILLQVLILLTLFFSYPLAGPYRLFQSYIPLEECNISNTFIKTSRKRKGDVILKTVNNNIESDYRVSLDLGSWIKEPQKIKNTRVVIYECPYLHWFPLAAQVEINGKIYYKYDDEDRFNEISKIDKTSFFLLMPSTLVLCILFLLYLNNKSDRIKENS